MSYEELVAKNLIRPFKAKDQQIKKQMELAVLTVYDFLRKK